MPSLHFEDFTTGSATPYGSITIDRDAMIAFAREFDAQPMHIDAEAAKKTMVGELISSGWYTASLNMRLMADGFILDAASLGSPGLSELKWLRPVRAGDTLSGVRHILGRRSSAKRPDRGYVNLQLKVYNQHGEQVLEQVNVSMFALRNPGVAIDEGIVPTGDDAPPPPAFRAVQLDTIPFYEELTVGDRLTLGELTFSEADIIRFARDFDPQFFHIDPEAAKRSIFGGLIASGWHTASGWMGVMARNRMASAKAAMQRGERPARLGPSPGFKHMRWLKPVFAGDTIRYSSAIFEKRESSSRPEWGIVRHYNTGENQRGELVFSFIGSVFWERRPQI